MGFKVKNRAPQLPAVPAASVPMVMTQDPVLREDDDSRSSGIKAFFLSATFTAVTALCAFTLAEKFAPEEWKPSYMIGHFSGATETAHIRAQLDAAVERERRLNEEKARLEIEVKNAETENENLKAQYQARMQQVSLAYQTLYQRANLLAQATVQVQQQAASIVNQMAAESQSGKQAGTMIADLGATIAGMFGEHAMASRWKELARNNRDESLSDIRSELSTRLPTINLDAPALLRNIPQDLASVIATMDQAGAFPSPRRPVPPPVPYQAVPQAGKPPLFERQR